MRMMNEVEQAAHDKRVRELDDASFEEPEEWELTWWMRLLNKLFFFFD